MCLKFGLVLELTKSSMQKVLGSLLGVKRLGCEVDHSPPSNTEFKNKRSFTYALLMQLHGVTKENSTFYCLFLAQQPPAVQGLLIHEVSRSHTTKHRIR